MESTSRQSSSGVLYEEEQYFSNFWFWAFLAIVFSMSLIPIVVELYNGIYLENPQGTNPDATDSLLIILGILILVYAICLYMFKKMKLVVTIKATGIYYRYPPFILKDRSFGVDEIHRWEIRKYAPIKEYGGWGIKYGWGKSGRALNVKGNTGLQLYLKDGKKVLIGTQRSDALKRAMNRMMQEDNG